jgi:8-oxo-dGTP pyrophosphatase MutT (NUDIX family)
MKKFKVAGIVVYRYFDDVPKYLGLWTGDFYDLAKGHIDPGETPFQAAVREAYEESGILNIIIDKSAYVYTDNDLVMFLGKTPDYPIILPNPSTGISEHEKADWLTFEEISGLIKPSLLPAIIWANDHIMNKTIY